MTYVVKTTAFLMPVTEPLLYGHPSSNAFPKPKEKWL